MIEVLRLTRAESPRRHFRQFLPSIFCRGLVSRQCFELAAARKRPSTDDGVPTISPLDVEDELQPVAAAGDTRDLLLAI
jgi:hypothetical protein